MAELGCQDVIAVDLVDDPMLTAGNIKTFKKAFKELYDFAMVRSEYFSACMHYRVVCLTPLLYTERDHSLTEEIREVKGDREWSPRACCQGETHIRGANEEQLPPERAQHAEAGMYSRDMASQEQPTQSRGAAQGREESAPR
jgi:hypothetical protein